MRLKSAASGTQGVILGENWSRKRALFEKEKERGNGEREMSFKQKGRRRGKKKNSPCDGKEEGLQEGVNCGKRIGTKEKKNSRPPQGATGVSASVPATGLGGKRGGHHGGRT